MPLYLVNFAQTKEEFRLPELVALAKYFKRSLKYEEGAYDNSSPYMVVELESDEAVKDILSRAILIREIIELYAGPCNSLEEIHQEMKSNQSHRWQPYLTTTFKFDVDSYGPRIHGDKQKDMINSFAYSFLDGDIKMNDADVVFGLRINMHKGIYYFGRVVGESRRDMMERFNLKKRAYLGITSFEAELSLVMSNLALVGPGSLAFDPFVGTGSFLYTTSAFGAYSIGSDIDGRQLRGKDGCSFKDNMKQYEVENLVLGGLIQDIKHHAFRDGFKVDAIITDPPYGVRAGAKMIGGYDNTRPNNIPKDPMYRTQRYPKTIPYDMDVLVSDLYDFGVRFLNPGGRLLFWFPVDRDRGPDGRLVMKEIDASILPRDPRYTVIADCLQRCRDFDRWLMVAQLN